jgi:pyruvate formate lyase activating enzyme
MHEALLYDKLKSKKVKCNLCNHHCLISLGKRGICGIRENKDGKLYSLVYGKAIAENIDPIEKKPFYHFLPGTLSLSIATVGCNFRCIHCQNAEISQITKEKPEDVEILGKDLPPEKVIQGALDNNCPSISYTYTEPTIFLEYALDCMKLAKDKGLKNNWVSNGYMTKEALDLISSYLDAINVDLKAFTEKFYQEICGARLKPVLENLKDIKKRKIHLEVTTLIIPEKNDSEKELKKIAEFIKKELGIDTPWHVSRFFPYYKLDHILPTPVEKINQVVEIGKAVGLKHVYAGNI